MSPRKEARVKSSRWDSRDWTALPIDAQWLYDTLLSQKGLTQAGVLTIPRREWSNLCGDDDAADRIARARKLLEAERYIVVDDETDELLIRTYIRHDVVDGPPGVFVGAMNAVRAIGSPKLREAVRIELMRLDVAAIEAKKPAHRQERPIDAFHAVLAALQSTPDHTDPATSRDLCDTDATCHVPSPGTSESHASDNRQTSDEPHAMSHAIGVGVRGSTSSHLDQSSSSSSSSDTNTSPPPEHRPDVEALCLHLADAVEANGSKRPNITPRWRTEARLILDRDKRGLRQAHNLIDWSQAHHHWKTRVMAMPKFRSEYDAMRLQAIEQHNRRGSRRATSSDGLQAGVDLAQRYAEQEAADERAAQQASIHQLPARGVS